MPGLILLSGGLVIVYTLFGGMEAVIWTDVVQSVVFIVGAAACVVVILMGLPEGPSQLFSVAARDDKFSLGSYALDLTQPTFSGRAHLRIDNQLAKLWHRPELRPCYQTADSDAAANRSVWLVHDICRCRQCCC